MTAWEKKITETLISHYFVSASGAAEKRSSLMIRSSSLFRNFDSANTDEKESYLEAAETLEQKGIVKLNWEQRSKGERIKTIRCENFEKLFEEAGKTYPAAEVEKIKAMLDQKVKALRAAPELSSGLGEENNQTAKVIALLEFFFVTFSIREIGQGIDQYAMEEFLRLLDFYSDPSGLEKITSRAISILLYRDSKHLENLLKLFAPLLSRIQKTIAIPDLAFFERSYPETMISGKITIEYNDQSAPLINAGGHILGLPLESVEIIKAIQLVSPKKEKRLLTIENKETFYAIAAPQKHGTSKVLSCYDCFLYTGGYPNSAACALIKILAASDFSFYHAGDLDPDGILILQNIQDITQRAVTPVRMDAGTFNQYQTWARTLSAPVLRQIKKVRKDVRAIPDIAGLLQRIEETGLGVEQEIVDYR